MNNVTIKTITQLSDTRMNDVNDIETTTQIIADTTTDTDYIQMEVSNTIGNDDEYHVTDESFIIGNDDTRTEINEANTETIGPTLKSATRESRLLQNSPTESEKIAANKGEIMFEKIYRSSAYKIEYSLVFVVFLHLFFLIET